MCAANKRAVKKREKGEVERGRVYRKTKRESNKWHLLHDRYHFTLCIPLYSLLTDEQQSVLVCYPVADSPKGVCTAGAHPGLGQSRVTVVRAAHMALLSVMFYLPLRVLFPPHTHKQHELHKKSV